MKLERQNKILELISQYEIETQDEMMFRLLAAGFEVTQATISRDMRELKLTKVQTAKGSYKYTVDAVGKHRDRVQLNHTVVDSIISVDYACNTIVLKTYPGLAMAVASAVDSLNESDILGCVGGDDTIIIVARTPQAAERVSGSIKERMRGI